MKKKTIIYIAGYGRSGSTLLERVLSSNKKLFGLGELTNFLDLIEEKKSYCSCGEELKKCSFWSNIIDKIIRQRNYNNNFNQNIFSFIFEEIPNDVEYVIDSSKTARTNYFRPIKLLKTTDFDVKIIHLVRDGRGCMWSNLKGSNRKMEKGLDPKLPFAAFRTIIGWPLANISAHLFQLFSTEENYYRVRYEDFVETPGKVLEKIGKFLNVNFDQQIKMLKKQKDIPVGHQLSGNRLRSKRKIILNKDVSWRNNLTLRHKLLFWCLNWPLALLYNYK
ncbi:sulfotransferase [Sporohalobacter salinus]|uniref:sulfotransferase n=1 Tax=Sporohalobacter salinus TaxID=1494606 RepID=UPI001961DB06|nr:hypothetical protein [Sporohalobacter salinus]